VSPKSLALVAAAVAVMAMGVYLFIQVKATPAQAHSSTTTTTARPSPVAERTPEPTTAPPPTPSVATPTPTPSVATTRPVIAATPLAAGEPPTDEQRANPRMDSMMELANKAYDAQDFDQATAIAGKVLSKDPGNVRMLRIMVSANCIGGDSAIAQQHYEKLPPFDREQMKQRCDRYGVTFKDPPQ
jgi:hypothetical protein